MKNFLTIVFPVFILVALAVNVFIPEPSFDSANEEIRNYEELGDVHSKVLVLDEMLEHDPLNVELNFRFLRNCFEQREKNSSWWGGKKLNEADIFLRYKALSKVDDNIQSDLGHFGLGVLYYYMGLHEEGRDEFTYLSNPNYPYINYVRAKFFEGVDAERSIKLYEKELYLFPEHQFAAEALMSLLISQERYAEADDFLKKADSKSIFSYRNKRAVYYNQNHIRLYIQNLIKQIWQSVNWIGFAAASFILIIWLIYLSLIKSHQKILGVQVVLALGTSMLFTLCTPVITDFVNYKLGMSIDGYWLNDLFYCIVGVGIVEELVKMIPFLLIVLLNKNMTEPIDYIFYAGVCALGFAFIENLIYFDHSGLRTIQGRALTSTCIHLFNSSLIAYGFVLTKFSDQKRPIINFLIFFGCAAFFHGFYDFWLVNETVRPLSFITFIFLLICMIVWASLIYNCINNSKVEENRWKYEPVKINNFLLYSLSSIFLFQYLVIGFRYGPEVANYELQKDVISGLFLLIFLTVNLSRFDLVPNYWAPIKFWDWDVFFSIPMVSPKYFNVSKLIGKEVELERFGYHTALSEYLPLRGQIKERVVLGRDKNWFLLKLSEGFSIKGNEVSFLLLKAREEEEVLLEKDEQLIQVRLVRSEQDIEDRVKPKNKFPFVDVCSIRQL